MNARIVFCKSSLAFVVGFFALSAVAQPEQWLEYHTSAAPRAYRWLELTTNPPPNVALPKLRASAWFSYWTNGMDASGGRWICLDRARKTGPCDRLFFDRNGNGRLDDETPITSSRRDETVAYFEPIKVVFQGEDGPISYHLVLRYYQFDEQRSQLLAGAGGWYAGQVAVGGQKHRLQLIDNTVNATFNDQGSNPSKCDRIVFEGEAGMDRYLGRYVEVDGQLYQIKVARDGAFVRVQKATDVVRGTVRVPESISEFIAVGECGHFLRKPVRGELALPVGKYRVHGWTIRRKDANGDLWKLSGYSFGPAADFEVTPTGQPTLDIGEPVRAALQATESKGQSAFNLRFLGNLGESVEILRGSERPRAPQLEVASRDGQFHSTSTFEYG